MTLLETLPPDHFLFASESVGEGHPDKLCDQISDAVLDACLSQDLESKVACECAAKSDKIFLLGEISTNANINFEDLVRKKLLEIGYDDDAKGTNGHKVKVVCILEKQSTEIAKAVHLNKSELDLTAGDQGHMFGYATGEWDKETLFPFSHYLASQICLKLAEVRKAKIIPWLRPDNKSQVTVEYIKEGAIIKPLRVFNVLVSTQHNPNISNEEIRKEIIEKVIKVVIPKEFLDEKTIYYINPSSSFVVGGPAADAGLTGRKIIVDTYGGWCPHGGGAFSGKDATKVDRSAAYYCRYVAKSLVHHNLCHRVNVQVSYAIGLADPLSINVDTYGTAIVYTESEILKIILENFDFRPGNIIKELNLKRPIYQKTAAYCHFGRMEKEFTWEFPKANLILPKKS